MERSTIYLCAAVGLVLVGAADTAWRSEPEAVTERRRSEKIEAAFTANTANFTCRYPVKRELGFGNLSDVINLSQISPGQRPALKEALLQRDCRFL